MINSTYKSNDDVYSRVDTLKSDSMMPAHGYLETSICLNLSKLDFSATPRTLLRGMVWFFIIFKFSFDWMPFHIRIVSKSVIQKSCYCVQ